MYDPYPEVFFFLVFGVGVVVDGYIRQDVPQANFVFGHFVCQRGLFWLGGVRSFGQSVSQTGVNVHFANGCSSFYSSGGAC